MVITVLEATVTAERAAGLQAAFRNSAAQVPAGFIRSYLVSAAADPTRWRIETLWTSREALGAMRHTGTPAGVLTFRAAGAEPSLITATLNQPSKRRPPDD